MKTNRFRDVRREQLRSHARGFTLVELLVVIATVALMVAFLVPTLTKARETARRTACIVNQRGMGIAMLSFEMDYQRLPNIKFSQGTLTTLEGQPWSNSSPTVDIYSNYTGTEEYRKLLVDYMAARVLPLQSGKHIYVEKWAQPNSLDCPSAEPNTAAREYDPYFAANPASGNPYSSFYRWGGLQIDIQPVGMNWLYWNGNTANYVSWRRTYSARVASLREIVLVNEVCRIGTTPQGNNNHMGEGLNAIWFDGTGGWIPIKDTVSAGIDTWAGGNRFGDAGVAQYRIPSARYAQVGGGFRIQEFNTYYGNGNMNPAYPDQVRWGLNVISKMGYAPQLNF